jgi:hypothetical protein
MAIYDTPQIAHLPSEKLDQQIEEARKKRMENKEHSLDIGKILYDQTCDYLENLKTSKENFNFNFSAVSDKAANEVLQCAVDYFTIHKNSPTDPGNLSLQLLYKAKSLAIGDIVRKRCQSNIDNLIEWNNNKTEIEKRKNIENDLLDLITILKTFEAEKETTKSAKILISKTMPILQNIENSMGKDDMLYLKLSTRVVAMVLNNIIKEVNLAQEDLTQRLDFNRQETIKHLNETFKKAWQIMQQVGSFKMEESFKTNRYLIKKETLKTLCRHMYIDISNGHPADFSSKAKKSGIIRWLNNLFNF